MGIAFGIIVLILIALAILNRRKADKAWVKEERYEESGAWIDKRASERGAYGSLDEEMERERLYVSRQNRINELARMIRDTAFEEVPGFHERPDADIKAFNASARARAEEIISAMEKTVKGQLPEIPPSAVLDGPPFLADLKKSVLQFAYHHFPSLLEQDIEALRALDNYTGYTLTRIFR